MSSVPFQAYEKALINEATEQLNLEAEVRLALDRLVAAVSAISERQDLPLPELITE